ncbi:glycosyltransferase family 77 protein [Backusella circina FSU 941]|nr:glycosyltransferase family 77 protein [Backusella circina FSU 941]
MAERFAKNKMLIMVLASIFLLSLLVLLSNLIPNQSRALWGNKQDISQQQDPEQLNHLPEEDIPEEENLVTVNTAPLSKDNWKPKTWGRLEPDMTDIIERNTRRYKKDKVLLTAVSNGGMSDYTLNWIASLKRCKLDDKFIVFAIDQGMVDTMTEAGYRNHVVLIPETWFHKQLSGDFQAWLSDGYTPITHAKSLVVERLLYADITVWFSDVDIVFRSPHLYDYLMLKLNARKTEVLFSQETEQDFINSGFYVMRPTLTNKRILASSIYIQDHEPQVTQQRAMIRILQDENRDYHTSPIALLDLMLFPHGRLYFDQGVPTKYDLEPMIVHANYRKGDRKREDLKKFGLWYI